MSVTAHFGSAGWLTSALDVIVGTNALPQAHIAMSIPHVMFANDDDDNKDGTNDYERVDFGDLENDIVKGSVVFTADELTNGTLRIDISGFAGDVYTNNDALAIVPDTFDVAIEDEDFRTIDLYFNPYCYSAYQNGSVSAVWLPLDGAPQTSSVPFSVIEPVAETICAETVEHSVQGTNHVYTVNPCGVAVGDDAYFRVKVSPLAFPDAEIVWTNRDGHVAFVDGNVGRCVHVRGVSAGDAELEVMIGGRTRQAPTFPVKVVEPREFKITAWIVTDAENNGARNVEDVQNMIVPLNDIYRQVGVSFYLDSITVTNIPNAFNAYYDQPMNMAATWTFNDIVSIASGTGGLECYFINKFIDSDDILAANSPSGMVVSSAANYLVVAHEIGHAFGLRDIYENNAKDKKFGDSLVSLGDADMAVYSHMLDDWNGGCDGDGESGTRYYTKGTLMSEIVSRMLMNGRRDNDDNARDITCGMVLGVHYTYDANGFREWHKGDSDVDFPWTGVNPIHN